MSLDEFEIGKSILAMSPVVKLTLCFTAVKLAESIFGRDMPDDLAIQPNSPLTEKCARCAHSKSPIART